MCVAKEQGEGKRVFSGADYYGFILLVLIFLGLGLAVYKIWSPYSYWWDELFSVTVSMLPFKEMFKVLFTDVHPPLYQIVLKAWIAIFGVSEFAARSLSLVFVLLSMLVVFFWGRKILDRATLTLTLAFYSTSYLFAYYAQEARSYTMMLFLSSIFYLALINFYLDIKRNRAIIILVVTTILLSLTHFFGLIFSGISLIWVFFMTKSVKHRVALVLVGITSLIWPFYHFLLGGLSSKTGGTFWIKSSGIQTTIATFFTAVVPQTYLATVFLEDAYSHYILSILSLIIAVFVLMGVHKRITYSDDLNNRKILCFNCTLLISFLIAIICIDLYTPISTSRNFIVLLPITSITLAFFFTYLSSMENVNKLLAILFIVTSLATSYNRMIYKRFPVQNDRASAEFIKSRIEINQPGLYYIGDPTYHHSKMASFYLDTLTAKEFEFKNVKLEEICNLTQPFLIISQYKQFDRQKIIKNLEAANIKVKVFEPKQLVAGSSLVFYSE